MRLAGVDFGDGYAAKCRSLIETLGLAEIIELVGPSSEIPVLLSEADFGILSSDRESGPIAVAEYLAAGLPVIATDAGEIVAGLPEELRRYIVPPGDEQSLVEALDEIASTSRAERDRLGMLGREHALKGAGPASRVLDAIVAFYDRLRDRP